MNAVYIVGDRSAWSDNELKYSLRSLEKYVKGITGVVIVGHKPDFINDSVTHIVKDDPYFNHARNICEKIFHYCDLEIEPFLLMADDYYFLKPFDAAAGKYYYRGTLRNVVKSHGGSFVHHALATHNYLEDSGKPAYNFDCHYPMVINPAKFMDIYESINWENLVYGYTPKSLYANSIGIPFHEAVEVPEVKVRIRMSPDKIKAFIKGKDLFSGGYSMIGNEMVNFMEELYPGKSKYEK
jgi:hypothetical protein